METFSALSKGGSSINHVIPRATIPRTMAVRMENFTLLETATGKFSIRTRWVPSYRLLKDMAFNREISSMFVWTTTSALPDTRTSAVRLAIPWASTSAWMDSWFRISRALVNQRQELKALPGLCCLLGFCFEFILTLWISERRNFFCYTFTYTIICHTQ